MRYLSKSTASRVIREGWRYSTTSHRPQIRAELLAEQRGFCAYTERYVAPVDACEIEHFDDRLKNTDQDDYWNWYSVLRWANQRKKRIERYLPVLAPHDPSVQTRIRYDHGAFQVVEPDDVEAANLIELLGWNDPTLAQYREKFVSRTKEYRAVFFEGDDEGFVEFLRSDPERLSFISVLEVELKLMFS